MKKLATSELGRLKLTDFQQLAKLPVKIILDDVRSALNVGSVFRSTDAFMFDELILCGITARPPHKEILKTAIGATESVKWRHTQSITSILKELKAQGYTILAAEQTTHSVALNDALDWISKEKIAVIFGNEVSGVSDEALQLCEASIEIPQFGTKHSFNISVSMGIIGWEILKTKKLKA